MRTLQLIIFILLLFSCKDRTENTIIKPNLDNNRQRDSIISVFKNLSFKEINTLNIDSNYTNNKTGKFITKNEFMWLRKAMKDSIQFEKIDEFSPLFKVYENQKIVSIAFLDVYDYKHAIHIINFNKLNYKPISSFIIMEFGGDAEDFNSIIAEKKAKNIYKLISVDGNYNNIETKDTIFYNFKKTILVELDTMSGIIRRKKINERKKFYELAYKTSANSGLPQ